MQTKPHSSKEIKNNQEDIRIIKESFDSWEVEVFFKKAAVTEDLLSKILKKVKKFLTDNCDVDEDSVRYKKMTGNRKTQDGMLISLLMERVALYNMPSELSIQPMLSEDGIPYAEMACFGNLKCEDEFGNKLSAERLLALIKKKGVQQEYIEIKAVEEAISELAKTNKPIENIRLAQGIFPEKGKDAIIEYYFQAVPAEYNFQEYINSRKVENGYLLCSKIPPVPGNKSGKTVRSRDIPPVKGLDVLLEAGKNVSIDSKRTQLTATANGIILVAREEKPLVTPFGLKTIPTKITVAVDTLETIEVSDKIEDIKTSGSVAILGTLAEGSTIISGGEVHIDGNISENSFIQATHNVIINGMVWKGGVSSDKNIIAIGKVIDGKLSAGENVIVKGNINNSTVYGKDIFAENINGGTVYAGNQLVAATLGTDIDGNAAKICVGMKEFLNKKIQDNKKLTTLLMENLHKVTAIFGDDIVREVRDDNLQMMLFKFIAQKKGLRESELDKKAMESHKKLLSGIVPLRTILHEKKKENSRLNALAKSITNEKKMLIIKEKVTARTIVSINNIKKVIKPQPGPLKLTEEELMDLDGIYEV